MIFPEKLTRSTAKESLFEQFHDHVLLCPLSMDNIIYVCKQKQLPVKDINDFMLCLLSYYLEKPQMYADMIDHCRTFEYFCIDQLAAYKAIHHVMDVFINQEAA